VVVELFFLGGGFVWVWVFRDENPNLQVVVCDPWMWGDRFLPLRLNRSNISRTVFLRLRSLLRRRVTSSSRRFFPVLVNRVSRLFSFTVQQIKPLFYRRGLCAKWRVNKHEKFPPEKNPVRSIRTSKEGVSLALFFGVVVVV
jgi:hypothetical protein